MASEGEMEYKQRSFGPTMGCEVNNVCLESNKTHTKFVKRAALTHSINALKNRRNKQPLILQKKKTELINFHQSSDPPFVLEN